MCEIKKLCFKILKVTSPVYFQRTKYVRYQCSYENFSKNFEIWMSVLKANYVFAKILKSKLEFWQIREKQHLTDKNAKQNFIKYVCSHEYTQAHMSMCIFEEKFLIKGGNAPTV